jgi:hypothetical protein
MVGMGLVSGDEVVEELPAELVANCNEAFCSATPPLGKMPSSTAARSIQRIFIPIFLLSKFNFRRPSNFNNNYAPTQFG